MATKKREIISLNVFEALEFESDDLLPLTLTTDITPNLKTDPQSESPALLRHHHHYAHASSSKISSTPTNLHKKIYKN